MKETVLSHLQNYPKMQAEDMVLLVSEAAFGGMYGGDEEELARDIEEEGMGLSPEQMAVSYVEPVGGGYCRMNLSVLQVLPVAILAKMVAASAGRGRSGLFQKGIKGLMALCDQGEISLSATRIHKMAQGEGVQLKHSREYIESYHPAYRVVREEFGKYLDVFVKIGRLLSRKNEVTVAIDGQSGAGKTTLSALIAEVFPCNVFHTTDFMRFATFDHLRFEEEVLKQLNLGKPFLCHCLRQNLELAVAPRRLNIVEGSYSLFPALEKYYELKIFMSVSPYLQSKRILKDGGEELFRHFTEEWIPRENNYIANSQTELKCDLIYRAG
ncbi:MAG: hypothetical protein RSC76_00490 [Oscillospiraceae bacterium]